MFGHRTIRVGLLGLGSVGSQVARLLFEHGAELAERSGARLELAGAAVRNLDFERDFSLPASLLTTDIDRLILDSDIVVELIGGVDPARVYIKRALETGADVITANKAVLACCGPELFGLANQVGAQLLYEAAVCAAIPVVRPLKDSLAGDRVLRIMGIVNGTTNFILDSMQRRGHSLDESLALAADLGYAEADPTADISGYDAAAKAAILASLAFHTAVPLSAVYREGIERVSQGQVAAASRQGQVIKLLAICERITDRTTGKESVNARVYPALISKDHPLAAVHENNNAVFIEAESAGNLMFYGAGAGGVETASAVLGDLVSAARRYVLGGPGIRESFSANLPVVSIDQIMTRYQIILQVSDAPGALAQIAQVFAVHKISLRMIFQSGEDALRSAARLVIGTQAAKESALADTVKQLVKTSAVVEVVSVTRIEGD